jgi:hypothetical protein
MKKLLLLLALAGAYLVGFRHGYAYLATKLVHAMAPILQRK